MKFQIINILIAMALVSSCKSFVEVDPPKNQLVADNLFTDNSTATSAIVSIYSAMINGSGANPYRIALLTGLSSDELNNNSLSELLLQVYKNNLNPVDAATNSVWISSYNFIYQANAVYEGCFNSTGLSPIVKKQLMGEALFIRAFWHLYLTNLFGEVPVVLTTDYKLSSKLSRQRVPDVYSQIIKDLIEAKELLQNEYFLGNSISSTAERVRPNKFSANALLARAYLYNQNYEKAISEATIVINETTKYDTVSLDNAFLKGSKEAIWQLMRPTPNAGNLNSAEGAYFILTSRPLVDFNNSSTLTDNLLLSFEPGDQRLTRWVSKFSDATVTPKVDYNFPNKYKVKSNSAISEYSIVLRLGELYLIRSEANANLGNIGPAIRDLDVIRRRARLSMLVDQTSSISKADLLKLILSERRHELFAEWGHRWIDIKRTGNANAIMSDFAAVKGSVWDSTKQLWPLPDLEIQNGVNLIQNEGYN